MATQEQALVVTKKIMKILTMNGVTDKMELFSRSIIAGGAVRDSILGKDIKDIDIFVPMRDATPTQQQYIQNNLKNSILKGIKLASDGTKYDNSDFKVYNWDDFDLPVQVILDYGSETPVEVVQRFPLSISQCYFVPSTNKVYTTRAFDNSKATKIALYKSYKLEKGDYIARIALKYPEYTFKKGL